MAKAILSFLSTALFATQLMFAQQVTIKTENSRNNRLYAGIDNSLIVDVNPYIYDSISLSSSNGIAFKDTNSFICIPSRSGRTHLKVLGFTKSDTISLVSKSLLVNSVPTANLKLGDNLLRDLDKIQKQDLINQGNFELYFNDDIINSSQWYTISDITFGYTIGGFFHRHINDGSKFNQETVNLIEKLKPGSEITIKVRIKGQGDILKTLPLYTSRLY